MIPGKRAVTGAEGACDASRTPQHETRRAQAYPVKRQWTEEVAESVVRGVARIRIEDDDDVAAATAATMIPHSAKRARQDSSNNSSSHHGSGSAGSFAVGLQQIDCACEYSN
jgi:hypothetical protein